jgi:threonine aldolase
MRQAGVIAACGVFALEREEMMAGLAEDNNKARRLAEGLDRIRPGIVDLDTVETNIVCFEFGSADSADMDCKALVESLSERGILTIHLYGNRGRMVTHQDVSEDDIDHALGVIASVVNGTWTA